jgi:hypothetical protein
MFMSVSPVLVFIEKAQLVPFVEALLRPCAVEVEGGFTHSGTTSAAELSLFQHPERPVAVVVDTRTEDARKCAEIRLAVKRILAAAYPENWYVGVAIPRMVAWAMTDPRFRRELDALDSKALYNDRAALVGELAKKLPFDTTELYRSSPDFRGLLEFVQKHALATTTAAKAASG